MNENFKQIGERLKGLREVLDIPAQEVADLCDITVDHLMKIEAGEADPSVYRLSKISKKFGISLDVLLFGEEPRMNSYFVTRKGQGLSINRNANYTYQSLASGFRGRKADIFLTQVDPMPDGQSHSLNSHEGQEFHYMIEGDMQVRIGEKEMILHEGDSLYFDASRPHCMNAIGDKPVKFIAVVLN
jgi:mannose-6-phosphate isomerase-like protein (cupin superfamily)